MKSAFAKNMIKARNFYYWTQQQAADIIGINRSNLGAYEEGRAEPPFAILICICNAYKIYDVYNFISNHNFDISNQSVMSENFKSVIEQQYSKITPKERRAINVLLGI